MKKIIEGHLKELLKKNQPLKEKRIAICRTCPLYKHTPVGPVCNPNLYLNVETGETSKKNKTGFVQGCGCRLDAKTRLIEAECPVGKW